MCAHILQKSNLLCTLDRIMQRYRYKERMRYKDLVVLVKAVYKQGLQLEAAFKKTTDEVDRMRYINRLGFEVDYEDFFEMLQEPSSSKDILEEVSCCVGLYSTFLRAHYALAGGDL